MIDLSAVARWHRDAERAALRLENDAIGYYLLGREDSVFEAASYRKVALMHAQMAEVVESALASREPKRRDEGMTFEQWRFDRHGSNWMATESISTRDEARAAWQAAMKPKASSS